MKLEKPITGIVEKVGPVKAVRKGFTQAVIIRKDAVKNDQGYTLSKEQFFVIHVWSNKQDDRRFLKPEFTGAECAAEVYLDGQRWQGRHGFEYSNKLNLHKWVEETN